MTTLTDLKLQNDRVEQSMAHMTDILLLIRTERQPERKEVLWQIYQQARLQMNLESTRLNHLIEQLQVGYKERNSMKRVSVFASVLVLLLVVFGAGFAVAQDVPLATNTAQVEFTPPPSPLPVNGEEEQPVVTAEPPIVVVDPTGGSRILDFLERTLPWLIVIGSVLLIIVGILGRELIVNLGRSSPVPLREAGISAGNSLIGSLENFTKTTEITLDDAGVAEFKKFFLDIVAEIRAEGLIKPEAAKLHKPDAAKLATVPTIANPDPWTEQYPGDNG